MTAVRLDAKYIKREPKAEKLMAKDLTGFRTGLSIAEACLRTLPEDEWTPEGLDTALRSAAEQHDLGLGKVMQPVRIGLTGGTVSEPVNDLLYVVGKEEALKRLLAATEWEPATE